MQRTTVRVSEREAEAIVRCLEAELKGARAAAEMTSHVYFDRPG
jgi:hypothetical protein